MTVLTDILDRLTVEGELVESLPDGAVRCTACGHRCLIRPGKRGICQVRFNEDGKLRVPWGYVAALQADPIEKKPFSHVMPGAIALTFGMLGCDFHCGYCQNWLTSQVGRDPASNVSLNLVREVAPAELVEMARRVQAQVVVSSYNEPLITSEWGVAVFKEARAAGLMCAYVSNGNNTPEVMEYIRPYIEASRRHDDAPRPSEMAREAMNRVDAMCADPRYHVSMTMQPGDMQFVNNYHVLHAREAYVDDRPAGKIRHLKRLWLETDVLTDGEKPERFRLGRIDGYWASKGRTKSELKV